MNNQQVFESAHPDFLVAQELIYKRIHYVVSAFTREAESQEYGACIFELNKQRIKFRVAKITPTKNGQFVTLWKRIGKGPILPYDLEDPFDLFVISVRKEQRLGHFVFPKLLLREKGILSNKQKGGKRALRVYPPWDQPESKQAEKTQAWQSPYFFELAPQASLVKAQALYRA